MKFENPKLKLLDAIYNVAEQAFNNPALSQKAKDVLKQARSEYALFKELQNSKIYHDVMGELKSSGDITNSLLKALNAENGLDLKALTARLSSSEQEALETNLIRGVIEKFTKDGITDFSKVSDTLKNAPFESKRAVEIMGELNKKAPILNNTSSLLEKLTAINPKAKELQQGIGHSVTGALMTMKRNLAIERLKSLLPVLGNDASLKNHIRNAINNAGDLKSVINNLEKIEIKDAPENSTKLLEAFKNEVKALREEAQTGEIKGDNFITKESPAPKSDLNVKISVDDWVRELSEINNNELSANLFILQNKHPELFKKPSDVYRLLKEIKNNPTHFFKNNRPDIALIVKVLEDGSVGKLGIVKESGHVGYLSKSTNKNEMDRLRKVNEKELKVGAPYPTLQRADINQVGPTAGAKSTFSSSDESIIPQKDKNTKTINASPHIASGLLGGTANGADENGNVSPEEFAKGFIYALFGSKFSASAVKRISPELYNSILGLGKKMSQMAKDNPKLLTKIYGSAKSNSINSFAGEKALNASANKLSKAKAMLEKGEDEVKIWQSTGWYKDKDGAWKFEIDDSPAKIKNQNADKLGDLLEHKELFKAYPELKDINVVKIKYELYNKNLKDWHKESSPLTKNIDGTPKIFYHGTKKSNISEFDQKFDKSKWGFFFTTDKGLSEEYSKGRYGLKEPNSGVMEVYINAKKPFDLREEITNDTVKKYQALLGNLAKRDDIKNGVGKSLYEYIKNTNLKQYDTKARAFKDKLQNAGYDSIILDDNVIVAFNPNQNKTCEKQWKF